MAADSSLVFCTAQNVFAAGGSSVASTDWIDLRAVQDMAGGVAPVLEVIVTTTFAGGTGANFQLATCDSAGGNQTVIDQTPTIPIAELVAPSGNPAMGGRVVHLKMSPKSLLPAAGRTHLRVLTFNSGTNTAGAITAHLVPEAGTAHPTKAYAAGF
jgi:hypothetical protein